jgi:molybdenum cofactor cytidylyltransferase
MSLAGVVLAAGRSVRMGTPKPLLDFRGRPFIIRILEALEALDLKLRLVVLGPDAARVTPILAPHDCVIIETPDVAAGPIGSLRAALVALKPLRPAAVLAWPVDLPHVRLATVERLIDAYARGGAPAVVPAFGARRGQPVIWDASLFEEIETSEAATRHGANAVLHAHTSQLAIVTVDDPAVLDDLNTPEDYERLVREVNRDIY